MICRIINVEVRVIGEAENSNRDIDNLICISQKPNPITGKSGK